MSPDVSRCLQCFMDCSGRSIMQRFSCTMLWSKTRRRTSDSCGISLRPPCMATWVSWITLDPTPFWMCWHAIARYLKLGCVYRVGDFHDLPCLSICLSICSLLQPCLVLHLCMQTQSLRISFVEWAAMDSEHRRLIGKCIYLRVCV